MATVSLIFSQQSKLSCDEQVRRASLKQPRSTVTVAAMFRLLGFIVFVAGLFGAGFYSGIKYYEHEMVQNPKRFVQLYKNEFSDTAKEKIDELKEIIKEKIK